MIKVENLTKRYAGQTAIQDLNFEVNQGEIVGFLGPNGPVKPRPCAFWLVLCRLLQDGLRSRDSTFLNNRFRHGRTSATCRKMCRSTATCALRSISTIARL